MRFRQAKQILTSNYRFCKKQNKINVHKIEAVLLRRVIGIFNDVTSLLLKYRYK